MNPGAGDQRPPVAAPRDSTRGPGWPWYAAIALLPLLLFHWMLPFATGWTIGNDYPRYSMEQQLELLFSWRTGTFPLFVPGFGGGQSASALTLGQLFHPLPHLAARLPGYWEGNALEWMTALRLATLGAAHLALFRLLCRLRVAPCLALPLTTVAVYNLRMLDLFRYGAALESWTGHLFLCAALGWFFLEPKRTVPRVSIVAATYWLVASGHPQMMYLGLLGAGLFALAGPAWIAALGPDATARGSAKRQPWAGAAALGAAGLLLAAAYLTPLYFEFVSAGTARVGQGYAWADGFRDTFAGTVNSWFRPLAADVHGAFGVSSLLIVAASAPLARLLGVPVPPVVWAVWSLLLGTFACVQGDRTAVHQLLWEHLPFASSFRVAGRYAMLMPIPLMMLGAWLVRIEPVRTRWGRRTFRVAPVSAIAAGAIGALAAYRLWLDDFAADTTEFAPVAIGEIPGPIEPLVLAAGMVGLIALGVGGGSGRGRRVAGLVLCLATVAEATLVLRYGTWRERALETATFATMAEQKRAALGYRHESGLGLYAATVERQLRHSHVEPSLARLYPRHLAARDTDEAYALLARGRRPDEVVVEGIRAPSPTPGPVAGYAGTVELVRATYNQLELRVQSTDPGFLGLAYPYSDRWTATVDDRPVTVYRANGGSNALPVPAGESRVAVAYGSPAAHWGMGLTCLTLAGLGIAAGRRRKGRGRWAISGAAVLAGTLGFAAWSSSPYRGEGLGTEYRWAYAAPGPEANLAFGRPTRMSSQANPESPDWFHGSRGVDGNHRPRTGFLTRVEDRPTWSVDLFRPTLIGAVVLHEARAAGDVNVRPLVVAISDDRVRWRVVAKISNPGPAGRIRIEVEPALQGRFVSVQSVAESRLALDEVEVLGAAK